LEEDDLGAELFDAELFDAELFDADALGDALADELAVDFFALPDFDAELLEDERLAADALLLRDAWLRDLRAVRTGRFQPTALSARNVCGIEITLSGLSTTEATAASARSARTSEMTLAGRRARAAWTRFVSSSTNICRSGSIQIDVPV
jgi:hypothetical protein